MDPKLDENLSRAFLSEYRSNRRWKNIRFFVWIVLILVFFISLYSFNGNHTKPMNDPYAALIRLDGLIMPGKDFSAKKVVPLLNKAFRDKEAKGVVLLIDSPGGSPVQASIIHDKIVELKKEYDKKVIVVGEDALASGAYLVATAADKIYVNDDTLTGSIGVIMSGFGFEDAIQKLGVTRRVFTSGEDKDRLDPFKSLDAKDVEKIHTLLNEVHQSFIKDVEEGREGKLKGDTKTLFSGDFWTGQTAVKLGLADQTANVWTAMKENFDTTYYKDYSVPPSIWDMVIKDVSTVLPLHLSNQKKLEAIL